MSRGILGAMELEDGPIQTVADYVRVEEESSCKHEFYDGQIRAMTGGSLEHARLAAALMFQLGKQLEGRPCVIYTADLRVRIQASGVITYPDFSVYCEPPIPDLEDKLAHVNPTVLVEVTSKSSERYDRGKKYEHYKRIPSLREYVIVSQTQRLIEVYRRSADGTWSLAEQGGDGDRVSLVSIDCTIDVSAVYRNPHTPSS